ncbi:hypothetical protein GGI25_005564 [Coemansia spiralis]|uniref:SH3b domain-containing protein n=2 Tax=Coemansia TaxID=4863 RepID=A0A9W8G3M0_9FUNG|nr:hypothetical protein GGI26_005809 [Coemansia sp. RSA 1358]KAJ2671199.1 hypothetical protein GGI25_005564 [Coemansia spiralis]
MMKSILASLSALLLASQAAAYTIQYTATLNCREGPSTSTKIVKVYNIGQDIEIICQINGQTVSGTKIWDRTQDGCYVLDYYILTGMSTIFKPVCTSYDKTASASLSATSSEKESEDESRSDVSAESETDIGSVESNNNSSTEASNEASNEITSASSQDDELSADKLSDESDSVESHESSTGKDTKTSSSSHARASISASVLAASAALGYALSLF